MSGRDSLPHFPAPSKGQQPQPQQQQPQQSRPRPPPQQYSSQGKMYQPPYQQQQPAQGYQQQTSSVPGAYPGSPVGGYQVGPPGAGYGGAYPPQQQQAQYSGVSPAPAAYAQPRAGSQQLQAPPGVDPQLYSLFKAADVNNSGQLSERELSRALVNGDWTPFDPKTVKLMVKMFDVDQSGTIGLEEFIGLWKYLDQWRGLFKRFDVDASGAIDRNEFANALSAFGYRLSDNFVGLLFASYDKKGDGQIGFDMFVQGMVTVKTLTEVFKTYSLTPRDCADREFGHGS